MGQSELNPRPRQKRWFIPQPAIKFEAKIEITINIANNYKEYSQIIIVASSSKNSVYYPERFGGNLADAVRSQNFFFRFS
jgi:hypothetical protein